MEALLQLAGARDEFAMRGSMFRRAWKAGCCNDLFLILKMLERAAHESIDQGCHLIVWTGGEHCLKQLVGVLDQRPMLGIDDLVAAFVSGMPNQLHERPGAQIIGLDFSISIGNDRRLTAVYFPGCELRAVARFNAG